MKIILLSILSGILFAISWPTQGISFFIFVAFVPLLLMESKITQSDYKKKSLMVFGLSYLAFMIWNILTTGWLYNAQNPDGSPALMAVVFPVVVNSLLMTIAFQGYHWFKKESDIRWALMFFVVVWMSFEKFHLEWEFTWPWLNLGNAFSEYPKLIQWYDTIGATGGSFWILLINALIFYGFETFKDVKQSKKNITIVLSLIFLPMIVSLIKYHRFDEETLGKVKVMLLQPDLDPYTEKYDKDSLQIVQDLIDLSQKSKEKIDYYIAPETAFPGRGGISERGFHNSNSIHLVENFLKNNPKSIFLSGISSYKIYMEGDEKPNTATFYPDLGFWLDSYNTAIQIIPNQEKQIYHKGKLVPGVEIFPYMDVLKPLVGEAMLDFGGTVASLGVDDERKVFLNPFSEVKVAPIICYESIYGEYCTEYVKNGADFLAIMTNDSWWGVSEGHKQLLSYARLRAIETRREVARSANSGISAHINVKGEIIEQTSYGKEDHLVVDIQLYKGETIYTIIGDTISKICFLFLVILVLLRVFFNKKVNNFS